MPNEAATCRKLVVPKLQPAGWEDAPKRLQAETAAELDAPLPAIAEKAFKREL
jgi:hypothetical protein